MRERIYAQRKNAATPSMATQSSSPLFQQRRFSDEQTQPVASNSTKSNDWATLQRKIAHSLLNRPNISPYPAAKSAALTALGGIQPQQVEEKKQHESTEVLLKPQQAVQLKCSECETDEYEKNINLKPEAETIQRLATNAVPNQKFNLQPSGNLSQLPHPVQQKMSAAFGANFSDVRIHEGPQAKSIKALAYTQGNHIHFAPGKYNPTSEEGQKLLGHELTHVVQQRAGRVPTPQGKGTPINADAGLEAEADELGAKAAKGEQVTVAGASGGVQRKSALTAPIQMWPNWSEIGHAALDVAGFIPVVGAVADVANAAWYLAEGDHANAALSAVSAIPGVGDAIGGAAKGGKAALKLGLGSNMLGKANKLLPNAGKLVGKVGGLANKVSSNVGKLVGKVGGLANKIRPGLKSVPGKVKGGLKSISTKVKRGFNTGKNKLTSKVGAVKRGFNTGKNKIVGGVKRGFNKVKNKLTRGVGGVKRGVKTGKNKVVGGVKRGFNKVKNKKVKGGFNAVKGKVKGGLSAAKNKFNRGVDTLNNKLRRSKGKPNAGKAVPNKVSGTKTPASAKPRSKDKPNADREAAEKAAREAAERAAREAKEKAAKEAEERAKKIAECEAIHAAYDALGKCQGCQRTDTPEVRAAKIACITAVIAGRQNYLSKRCDYILPGSIARGSAVAERGHQTQVRQHQTMLKKCNTLPTS